MRSLAAAAFALASLVVIAGAAAQGRPARGQDVVRFQTPSRNVGCLFSPARARRPAYLRCDILSGIEPEPDRPCRLDWTGFAMNARGPAYLVCAGDTVYARTARVLRYGKRWKRGPFTCVSRRTGLGCANRSDRGFVLARGRSFAF